MTEEQDRTLELLAHAQVPPLPAQLRQRTLALAQAYLTPPAPPRWSAVLVEYLPPAPLVPALLSSVALLFAIDALLQLARYTERF